MATITAGRLNRPHILTGQATDLVLTVEEDGTANDIGTITVGVVDGNGDEVVASGTAVTDNGDGTYAYTLAAQTNPDLLTVTWTEAGGTELVTRLEVVGGLLFTEAQARSFQAKADASTAVTPLKNTSEYTDQMVADERERILNDLENWTNRGWIPRYARVELTGRGGYELDLADGQCRTSDGHVLHRPGRLKDISQILSVTADDTSIATSNFVVRGRKLRRTDNTFPIATIADPFNVVVEYVYGLPYPADGVDRIAMKLLVDRLVPSAFPDRATSVDTEFGTTRFVQPGGPMKNVSRVPEVNDWVNRHDYRQWI